MIASASVILLALAASAIPAAVPDTQPAPELVVVTDEADAALEILALREAGRPVTEPEWRRLFATEGYRRLKAREAAMGRAFDDAEFQAFLLSDTLLRRAPALRQALADWKQVRSREAAAKAQAYLPAGTRLRARVYLLVKPRTNSFVFEVDTDPAIMLYLDPAITRPRLENTIAHELHHVGYAAACAEPADSAVEPRVATARRWVGAFGEGVAMLAAAGGPEVHPHEASEPEDRIRWDRDVANAPADLRRVEVFLLDVLHGRLSDPDSVRAAAMQFFGVQGPWYTVGWVMASTIERADGRAALLQVLCDPPALLRRYNDAARRLGSARSRPVWSDELLGLLGPTAS